MIVQMPFLNPPVKLALKDGQLIDVVGNVLRAELHGNKIVLEVLIKIEDYVTMIGEEDAKQTANS